MADRAKHLEEPAAATKGMPQKPSQTQQVYGSAPSPVFQPRSVRVPPTLSRPADILMLQQTIGNRAVMRLLDKRSVVQARGVENSEESVQLQTEGQREPSNAEIHAAAARGVSTPATTLPFLDRIQSSFGRHSIGHIKAHVGPEAARAARDMNALAFASGDHVVFGGTPDLHTAAHEAAHVIQQQAGVRLAGGIGREGDVYERHADVVADAVVTGRLANGLLEPFGVSPVEERTGAAAEISLVEGVSGRAFSMVANAEQFQRPVVHQAEGTAQKSVRVTTERSVARLAIQRMLSESPLKALQKEEIIKIVLSEAATELGTKDKLTIGGSLATFLHAKGKTTENPVRLPEDIDIIVPAKVFKEKYGSNTSKPQQGPKSKTFDLSFEFHMVGGDIFQQEDLNEGEPLLALDILFAKNLVKLVQCCGVFETAVGLPSAISEKKEDTDGVVRRLKSEDTQFLKETLERQGISDVDKKVELWKKTVADLRSIAALGGKVDRYLEFGDDDIRW